MQGGKKKWARDINRHFLREATPSANKHKIRRSTPKKSSKRKLKRVVALHPKHHQNFKRLTRSTLGRGSKTEELSDVANGNKNQPGDF